MIDENLTHDELMEIAQYTVQKIENYPKSYGKTVDNYFDLLFPDEVNNYLIRQEINRVGRENLSRRKAVELCQA